MYKKLPLLSFPLTLSGYPYFSLCHLITLALIKAENPHKQRKFGQLLLKLCISPG